MKTTSRFAVAAAAGLFIGGIAVSPAQAADLGGDCCADLEERVAELEATTVRKGNRKVSVTLSGQINRLLLFWDDGVESNVYEVDNTNSSSRFNLTGSATIRPGLTAGFRFIWELNGPTNSSNVNQIDDDGALAGNGDQIPDIREANWWIKSDKVGKFEMGRHQPATDNIILLDLGGSIGGSNAISFIGGGFFLRDSATGFLLTGRTVGNFLPALDTARREGIMYTSPTFGGATLKASWGEDDTWDVAIWYAKEWNSVRVVAGIGYLNNHDEEADRVANTVTDGATGNLDNEEWKGSASIMHVPSGLFVTGAFVSRDYGGTFLVDAASTVNGSRPDFNWYYLSAGIRKRWNSLGQSSIYGEWSQADDGFTGLRGFNLATGANSALFTVTNSELEMYGIGVEQDIDNAAMELFAAWRHFEFDVSQVTNATGAVAAVPLEDLDIFYVGGRIRF